MNKHVFYLKHSNNARNFVTTKTLNGMLRTFKAKNIIIFFCKSHESHAFLKCSMVFSNHPSQKSYLQLLIVRCSTLGLTYISNFSI